MTHIQVDATLKPQQLSFEELGPLPRSAVFGNQDVAGVAKAGVLPEIPLDSKYDEDMDAGYKTVYVIGLNERDLPGAQAVAQNVQDYLSFITGNANSKLAEKIKQGLIKSDDYVKQSDYRARLMHALVLSTKGFLALDADVGFTHSFSSTTVNLHTDILKILFTGLMVPTQLLGAFEGLFSSLNSTILKISVTDTVENKHIFLIIKSFVKNDLGIVDVKLRIFLFQLSNKVKDITVAKAVSVQTIDINLNFQNTQYQWNDKIYQGVSTDMNNQLVQDGKDSLNKVPTVDVEI